MNTRHQRPVVVLGTADLSSHLTARINQSQREVGGLPIAASLVVQADGSLTPAETFLAAHPETRVIVLQARAFGDRIEAIVTNFANRNLQVLVTLSPTEKQPLASLDRRFKNLGAAAVVSENRRDFVQSLESAVLRFLDSPGSKSSGVTRTRSTKTEDDFEKPPQHLRGSVQLSDVPSISNFAQIFGYATSDSVEEPGNKSLGTFPQPSGAPKQQVRTEPAPVQPTPPISTKPEACPSDAKITTECSERIKFLEGKLCRLEEEIERIRAGVAQEQKGYRDALSKACDAFLFAGEALKRVIPQLEPVPEPSARDEVLTLIGTGASAESPPTEVSSDTAYQAQPPAVLSTPESTSLVTISPTTTPNPGLKEKGNGQRIGRPLGRITTFNLANGMSIHIRGDTLSHLLGSYLEAARSNRVLSRDEQLDLVRHRSPDTLRVYVSAIRKMIRDQAGKKTAECLIALPKTGYRWDDSKLRQ